MMLRHASLAIIFFVLPVCVVKADECSDLRNLIQDIIKDPETLKGQALSDGNIRANFTLSGAYQCLYINSDNISPMSVDCVWLSKSYAKSQDIFSDVRKIVKKCSFVLSDQYHFNKFNSDEDDRFTLDQAISPNGIIKIKLHNSAMNLFADPTLGSRQVILSFSRHD